MEKVIEKVDHQEIEDKERWIIVYYENDVHAHLDRQRQTRSIIGGAKPDTFFPN